MLLDPSRDNPTKSLLLCPVKRVSLEFGERSCSCTVKISGATDWSKLLDPFMKVDDEEDYEEE
jgi:hypothetical protein